MYLSLLKPDQFTAQLLQKGWKQKKRQFDIKSFNICLWDSERMNSEEAQHYHYERFLI